MCCLYCFLVNRSLAFEDFLTVIRKVRLVPLPQSYLHILVYMHRFTILSAKFFGKADFPAVIKSDPPLIKELVMVGAEQESIVHIQSFSCVALRPRLNMACHQKGRFPHFAQAAVLVSSDQIVPECRLIYARLYKGKAISTFPNRLISASMAAS